MQRSSYKAIDRYYNQTEYINVPLPVFRRSVMPNQTLNLAGNIEVRTPAWPVTLDKLVVTAHWFYVPYSQIWEGWVDFITEGTGTFPTSGVLAPKMFDQVPASSMMRRAYKLVYNQFFADENSDTGLYDVTADGTVVFDKPVLALEQRMREVLRADQFTPTVFPAPVVGTDANIDHSDFSRSAAKARRDFNFQKTGDKYVDFLRNFGANPDFNEQAAPEHLGTTTRDAMPRVQAATDGANLGALRSYYSAKMPYSIRNKRFEEHGIVIGVAYARPVVFNKALDPADLHMVTQDRFFSGTNVNQETNWSQFGGTVEDIVVPPAYRYTAGQHVFNSNGKADMALTIDNGDINRRYGVITITPDEPTLGTDCIAYLNDCTMSGASPASTSLVF